MEELKNEFWRFVFCVFVLGFILGLSITHIVMNEITQDFKVETTTPNEIHITEKDTIYIYKGVIND